MNLGSFTLCLAVKDLQESLAFYEKLGFTQIDGDEEQGWLILQNSDLNIGIFQGMFEDNMLSFHPGWTNDGQPLKEFTDVRELHQQLEAKGLPSVLEADDVKAGPAYFVIEDPDGNTILIDQHV